MENKIKAYIGFAIKSGKIVFGYDNLIVAKKNPELVLICQSQNDKVTNKVINFCELRKIPCVKLNFVLGDLIGRNCKVIGIMDKNLSVATKKELKMEN